MAVFRFSRCEARAFHASIIRTNARRPHVTKTLGPITLTLDTRQQVTHSRVVLDDL